MTIVLPGGAAKFMEQFWFRLRLSGKNLNPDPVARRCMVSVTVTLMLQAVTSNKGIIISTHQCQGNLS